MTHSKTLTPEDGYEFEVAAKMINYYGGVRWQAISWLIPIKWGDSGTVYRFQMKDGRTGDIDLTPRAHDVASPILWEDS